MPVGIYKAMIGVMRDIGPIAKNQRNDAQRYMFRGIDDLYNAIQPAMVTNGVIHIPTVLQSDHYEERRMNNYNKEVVYTHAVVSVKHTFFAEDGSSVEAITTGEAMDTSDKAFNKAQTASYKYALFHIFNIPTEEEKKTQEDGFAERDADMESPGAPEEMRQSAPRSSGNGRRGARASQAESRTNQQQKPPAGAAGASQQAPEMPPQMAPAPQPIPTGPQEGQGVPEMAGQREFNLIAKLCAAKTDRKPAPFREQDIYKKFNCQKETCTKDTAYEIITWFKRNYSEIDV